MANQLNLNEIYFGKIDAYNELQEYGSELFKKSFLQYEKYKMEDFIFGRKYFVCGNKGTGKTAFLKYLECILSDDPEKLIIPIRFKSDFDVEDKKLFRNAASNIKEEVINEINTENQKNFVLVWQVFLINKIFQAMDSGEFLTFLENDELTLITKLLKCLYGESKSKLMPRLTKGYAKVNGSLLKGINAELKVDIEFNEEMTNVNFNKAAKKILSLFKKLEFYKNQVYVIFDELELSVKSKKENERDIELVRDLILAVDKLNNICKTNGYEIRLIASVRNEVINSVLSSGYEINKSIEDYGINVTWYQKGGDYGDSPLLKLIENKIIASEKQKGINEHEDVWDKYFPDYINDMKVKKYILNYSWNRPRDVIRMLGLVQQYSGVSKKFTQEMFDRAMQDYSEKSWNEIVEELRLTYSDNDIKAIKKIFTNVEVPFSFSYLSKRIRKLGEIYDYVELFAKKYKLIDVLEKLFDWGVIGNSGQRMVFKFLGDRDLAPTENMIIHKPLRNFFAVKSKEIVREYINSGVNGGNC